MLRGYKIMWIKRDQYHRQYLLHRWPRIFTWLVDVLYYRLKQLESKTLR